ncbi:MAG: arylsulfatase A [Planctomycetota bacterium]
MPSAFVGPQLPSNFIQRIQMGFPLCFLVGLARSSSLVAGRVLTLGCIASTLSAAPDDSGVGQELLPANVVVFYLDDIGIEFYRLYDSVNAYGPGIDPFADGIYVDTPVLDSLAAKGVVFTSAYAAPVCSPGRASLLTGQSIRTTGVGTLIRQDFIGGLAEFGDPGYLYPTIADLAHRMGGEAGIIGKWHLGLRPPHGASQLGGQLYGGWEGIALRGGWDDVRCTFGNLSAPWLSNGMPGGYYNFEWYDNGVLTLQTGTYATTLQFDEALDYCENALQPFVAYVAPNAVHFPLGDLPPAGLVNTQSYIQGPQTVVYNLQAALEALDTELGNFISGLSSERLSRTMIIVMGDNGTDKPVMKSLQAEYGPLGFPYGQLINTVIPHFKHSLFEGGIRVPMIVSWPGIDQPGRISDALVSVSDILPTVAEQWDLSPGQVDGISFLSVLEDASVDALSHARQDLRVDFFTTNGDLEEARDHREVVYTRRMPDGRRFKLHRQFGLPANGLVSDNLYLLTDASGTWVDPLERDSLDIGPGSAFRSAYLELALALDPQATWNYCDSFPNSTGMATRILAEGFGSVTANATSLLADPVPPNTLGFFRYSSRAGETPFGDGLLCLGTEEFGPFDLPFLTSSAAGMLHHPLDLEAPPVAAAAISAGSTWRFQAFYRDIVSGVVQFNSSDGLAIRWVP